MHCHSAAPLLRNLMRVERLKVSEDARLRALRLRALEESPDAFATTLEQATAWPEHNWKQQARALPTFLAVRDGEDVGMVRCTLDRADSKKAFLISMWVAPKDRRSGVGRRLVEAVLEWAAQAGADRVVLDVIDHNRGAIALYAAMGFKRTGNVGCFPAPREHIREHQRERRLRSRRRGGTTPAT
ncbi:MAG: GNAT family N-acetyltransferase [Myxococcales bacterium]|nr:GNAT family N-acetyltransferase [Myxococcales bacterium]